MAISTKDLLKKIKEDFSSANPDLADGKSIKKAGSKFRYRILLDNWQEQDPVEAYRNTLEYKKKAKEVIQIKLKSQIKKAGLKVKMKDYAISMSDGFTAIKVREYYDYHSGMKMLAANEKAIELHKKYYSKVERKSREILDWVNKLDDEKYNRHLHSYLLQLIVMPIPIMSEKKRIQCQN